MVYNTQNHRVCRLYPSYGILKKQRVRYWACFHLQVRGRETLLSWVPWKDPVIEFR
jgi:hypothetical protein